MIPGNPYVDLAERALASGVGQDAQASATLALAYEQHQRNRLAAITARSKALSLPPDLEDLAAEEDTP